MRYATATSDDDIAWTNLERLELLRVIEYSQHITPLEPQGERRRGGYLIAGHAPAEQAVELLRWPVQPVLGVVNALARGVQQLPAALNVDRRGGVEVELHLVLAEAHLDQLGALQEGEV